MSTGAPTSPTVDDLLRLLHQMTGDDGPNGPNGGDGTPGEKPGGAPPGDEEPPTGPTGPRLIVRRMSEVERREIDWVWDRWLARRKVHLMLGAGGIGKGTLGTELAAHLSTGTGRLPDGNPAPLVRTLFLTSEDAADDTVKPRLERHGANQDNIFIVDAVRFPNDTTQMVSLADHVPLLEATIKEHGIGLLIVDALSDFLAGIDRNSEGAVRDVLTPLAAMAQRTGVAILGVVHPSKGNLDLQGFQRILGSSAFGNVARVVMLVCASPDGDGRKLLGVGKSNLAMRPPTLEWSQAEDLPIAWHGRSRHDINDTFGASVAKPRDDAEGFLREFLAGGMVERQLIERAAKAVGLKWRTVERAKAAIGIVAKKIGPFSNARWYWKLPDGSPSDPPDDLPPDDLPTDPGPRQDPPEDPPKTAGAEDRQSPSTQVAAFGDRDATDRRPPQPETSGGLREKPRSEPKTASAETVAVFDATEDRHGEPEEADGAPISRRPPPAYRGSGGLRTDASTPKSATPPDGGGLRGDDVDEPVPPPTMRGRGRVGDSLRASPPDDGVEDALGARCNACGGPLEPGQVYVCQACRDEATAALNADDDTDDDPDIDDVI